MANRAASPVVASVTAFAFDYPIVGRFKFFESAAVRPTVLIRIEDEAGAVGWGQSVPSHTWSYETAESVQSTVTRYLAPALVGLDPEDSGEIKKRLDRVIAPSFSTGQPICKAGVDLALFDLLGRRSQRTAAEVWGRPTSRPITLSWTVDAREVAEVEAIVQLAHDREFHHFNLKLTGDEKRDVPITRELRRLAGDDSFLWADANGGYDLPTASRVAPRLAELGYAALEQPFPANRLSWFQRFRRQGSLPVLMDEAIVSRVDLEEFHRLDLMDGVAMKIARSGGLSESVRLLEYLAEHDLLFFASGLTDPDLSLAASLLMFSAYGLSRPAALNAPQYLAGGVLKEPLRIEGDQAFPPTGPGLGVEVDVAKLE